jgi:HlyD family secretion protein
MSRAEHPVMQVIRPGNGPTPIRDTAAQDVKVERPSRWRGPRPYLLAAIALAVVAGSAWLVLRWLGSEKSVDADRLRIAEVTRGTLVRDAAVNGRVVAAVSPTLYAPMPGTITLAIHAGDAVKKGDVLATIESPELANELAREKSTLAQAEAEVGTARIGSDRQKLNARREVDEAAIALTTATRELESADGAYKAGAISEVEFRRAQDAVETARIREKNARLTAGMAGRSGGFDVATAQTRHERQRLAVADLERRVAELTVRSPVDGVIGTLSVHDRQVVTANTPLLTVVDLSHLEVELEVPETYADDLGIGMRVEVRIGTATATGTLSAISPEVVANQVTARMRFDGAQPAGLRQSQRLAARILIEERADVLMVPRGPFLEAHGGRHVYVVEGELAVKKPIRVGVSSIGSVEILEGLSPGQRVVIAGSDTFGTAGTVRITD